MKVQKFYDKELSKYNLLNLIDPATAKQAMQMMEEYHQFMNIDKTSLENESQPSCLGAVISSFNTKHKRMVKVISGDDVFKGEITAMSWDTDQWIFMVDGEWYCQSEINLLQHPK